MAQRFCKVCKGWHDLDEPWPVECRKVYLDRRGLVSAPMVIQDGIEVTSMVDGKSYTSKSALRRSYREQGYVEVGDQKLPPPVKPKRDRAGIRNSLKKAFSQAGLGAV